MKRVKSHKRGENIDFVKEGISGRDFTDSHGWSLYSFATILKKQNDTNVSCFLHFEVKAFMKVCIKVRGEE